MKIIRDARLRDNCFKVGNFATGCMHKCGVTLRAVKKEARPSFTPRNVPYRKVRESRNVRDEQQ